MASPNYDPTRTTSFRLKWMRDIKRRVAKLKTAMRELVVDDDAFALTPLKPVLEVNAKREYQFHTDAGKVEAFRSWLQNEVDSGILEVSGNGEAWTNEYVQSAYRKGVTRGYAQVRSGDPNGELAFYEGSKAQFITEVFASPVTTAKLQMAYTRTYNDLKGFTDQMAQTTSRTMADAIAGGWNPRKTARALSANIDGLTKKRALAIARTETIALHADGQLDTFERLGVEEVGLRAEWQTAGDDRVCVECGAKDGSKYTIDEARGLIPLHVNCRCMWVPDISKSKYTPLQKAPVKPKGGVGVPSPVRKAKTAKKAETGAPKATPKQTQAAGEYWERNDEVTKAVWGDDYVPLTPEEIQARIDDQAARWASNTQAQKDFKGPFQWVDAESSERIAKIDRARDQQFRKVEGLSKIQAHKELDALAKKAQGIVEDAAYYRTETQTSLKKILKDGRVKTQFETGKSGGTVDVAMRREMARDMFGTPVDLDDTLREVYGWAGDAVPTDVQKLRTEMYGDCIIRMKKANLVDRTSVCFGDSLDAYGFNAARPTPVKHITADSLEPRHLEWIKDRKAVKSIDDFHQRYVELQFHGGVGVQDIEEVLFTSQPKAATTKALDKAGIPWKVL